MDIFFLFLTNLVSYIIPLYDYTSFVPYEYDLSTTLSPYVLGTFKNLSSCNHVSRNHVIFYFISIDYPPCTSINSLLLNKPCVVCMIDTHATPSLTNDDDAPIYIPIDTLACLGLFIYDDYPSDERWGDYSSIISGILI